MDRGGRAQVLLRQRGTFTSDTHLHKKWPFIFLDGVSQVNVPRCHTNFQRNRHDRLRDLKKSHRPQRTAVLVYYAAKSGTILALIARLAVGAVGGQFGAK